MSEENCEKSEKEKTIEALEQVGDGEGTPWKEIRHKYIDEDTAGTDDKFENAMDRFEKKLDKLAEGDESEKSLEPAACKVIREDGYYPDVYRTTWIPASAVEEDDEILESAVQISDVIDCVEAHLARYKDKAKTYDRDALAAQDALNELLQEFTQNSAEGGTE